MKYPLYLSDQAIPGKTIYDLRPDNPNPAISCPTARELEEARQRLEKEGYLPFTSKESEN